MNAWRCNSQTCHRLFTDQSVGHNGKLKICTECGEMVCNVTSTRLGKTFLAEQQKKNYVPSRVRLTNLDKTIKFMDSDG